MNCSTRLGMPLIYVQNMKNCLAFGTQNESSGFMMCFVCFKPRTDRVVLTRALEGGGGGAKVPTPPVFADAGKRRLLPALALHCLHLFAVTDADYFFDSAWNSRSLQQPNKRSSGISIESLRE